MSLGDEYRRQLAWRDWDRMFDALPPLPGATVLDLGCAIGDQAAGLVARGARVIGCDANEELLEVARRRSLPGAEFLRADISMLPELGPVDGIWCSFAAAYLVDLTGALRRWTALLRPGGWIALVEVDDLFAHEPLSARTRDLLETYADGALAAGRYDFRMGRKPADHLQRAGYRLSSTLLLHDRELAFAGAASPEVLQGWRDRLDRMHLLRTHCGGEFPRVRDELLACLASPDHRSLASVVGCLATKPASP